MKPLHGAVLITSLAVAIWIGGYWSRPEVQIGDSSAAVPPAAATDSTVQNLPQPAAGSALQPQQLKTFRGAQTDGMLRTNLHGELMIDMPLRRWLDFYLSAQGEVALETLVAAMHAEMDKLPQPGRDQAVNLLEDYLGYLAALAQYDSESQKRIASGSLDDLVARTQWQQRLRRQWLEPAVVEAFFSRDEALDNYSLARYRLMKQGASAEELAALEDNLPEDVQQMRQSSRAIIRLREQESTLQQTGAGEAEIQTWRTQEFGAEAAQRLAQVDTRQAEWHQRLQAYKTYVDSLALNGLSESDRERLLNTYRQRHFSADEIKRLPAALALLAAE